MQTRNPSDPLRYATFRVFGFECPHTNPTNVVDLNPSAFPTAPRPLLSSRSGSVSLAERDLPSIPEPVAQRVCEAVTLNLTNNALTSFEHIPLFTKLSTLILDGNGLGDMADCLPMPTVRTLWFNNNKVDDLERFLDQVCALFPDLDYLSMMRNPACPGFLDLTEDHQVRRLSLYTCRWRCQMRWSVHTNTKWVVLIGVRHHERLPITVYAA